MPEITFREAIRRRCARRWSAMTASSSSAKISAPTEAPTRSPALSGSVWRTPRRRCPIAEAGIIGTAVGASIVGLRPVAEMMSVNSAARARSDRQPRGEDPLDVRRSSPHPWSSASTPASANSQRRTLRPSIPVSHTCRAESRLARHSYDAKGLLKTAIRDRTRWSHRAWRALQREGEVPRSSEVPSEAPR